MLRAQRERFAVRRLGLDVLALAAQAERQIRPGLHRIGPEPHRGAKRGLRHRVPTLPAQRDAELIVEVRVVRS